MKKTFSKFNTNPLLNEDHNTVAEAGISLCAMYADRDSKDFSAEEYDANNRKFSEALVKSCLQGTGMKYQGLDMVKNKQVTNNGTFKENFANIISQVITPIAPAVVSEAFADLAEVRQIGWGETAAFEIKSNELFLVNDIAEGVQYGGLQRLYNNEITVSASPKQIRYDMPWYQIAAGIFDFGEWSYRLGASFAGYINASVIKSLMEYVDGLGSSNPYVANGFTDENWINVAQKVSAVNGRTEVLALGDLATVGTILPTQVGLQYGLGEEIAKIGYLDRYKGVRVKAIDPSMVPGTENTTAILAAPTKTVFMLPIGGYRPVKIVFEGQNVEVFADPVYTADKTTGLTVTMRVGFSIVLGSRFGVIKTA